MSELKGFEICIPFYAEYLHVRECIESILIYTKACPYRIFLVDDGSPNKDFLNEMKKLSNVIEGISHPEQRGFGAALNTAIKNTVLPFLVFLHSDIKIVDSKWLKELYKSFTEMRRTQKVELMCACSDNPPFEHVELTRKRNIDGKNTLASEPLPIFCAITGRSLYDKVGYFKEYQYGYFEDDEFCHRLKKYGYNEAICGNSWVKHHGGLTVKHLWEKNPDVKKIMLEENRLKCLEDVRKWHHG